MDAMKNLVHGVILAVWAVMGAIFSLKVLFGSAPAMHGLLAVGSYWLWFAGFAAVMSWAAARTEKVVSVAMLHGLAFLALGMIPKVMPFSLLRLGLDLLGSI